MAGDIPNGSGGFSQKEMLVRIEGKVDTLTQTVAAKHAAYDVEIALLKARADELERAERASRAAIEESDAKQDAISTRLNLAAGALALVVFFAPLLWLLVNKLVS